MPTSRMPKMDFVIVLEPQVKDQAEICNVSRFKAADMEAEVSIEENGACHGGT